MAILRVDCGAAGISRGAAAWEDEAARLGGEVAADAPTVIMIHGYRYDPAVPCVDPHATLYRDGPAPPGQEGRIGMMSWPAELGFTGPGRADGLAVAYGWGARAGGFAASYAAAGRAGAALTEVIETLAHARRGPIDLFAHSLGARVALSAIAAAAARGRGDLLARIGRVVLLGPAEFAGEARDALGACDARGAPGPEVYALLARGNDPFDLLFEAFAPRWANRAGGALGRRGLGERRRGWLDLAFDHPDLAPCLAARGVDLAPPGLGPCHWSFYARRGAMGLHRAILRRAPGFGAEELRAAGAPAFRPRRLRLPRAAPWAGPPETGLETA